MAEDLLGAFKLAEEVNNTYKMLNMGAVGVVDFTVTDYNCEICQQQEIFTGYNYDYCEICEQEVVTDYNCEICQQDNFYYNYNHYTYDYEYNYYAESTEEYMVKINAFSEI